MIIGSVPVPCHDTPRHIPIAGRSKKAAGKSHRKPRAGAGAGLLLFLAVVLVVGLADGYHASTAAAPEQPAVPPPSAGYPAKAAAAAAVLSRQSASAYTRTHLWQAASALGATIDFMRASGSRAYLSDLSMTYMAHQRAGHHFADHYYDDDGWWVLTWVKAYELTGDGAYLRQAKSIFAAMTKGWTRTCGGGVQWGTHRPYKNAITNEEFLRDAVLLHDATPGDTRYATWALREWRWFSASGLLTRSHLVGDGLARCRPRLGSPTWTYNQGMLIGALVSLAGMTGHKSLLAKAGQVAHAVMDSARLSPHGILREPCRPLSCGRDRPMFKGIFMENLKLLYDHVGGAAYQAYMRRNARTVWADDRRGDMFGVSWAGPLRAPAMTAQASALDVLTTQIRPR